MIYKGTRQSPFLWYIMKRNPTKVIYTSKRNEDARQEWESIALKFDKPEAEVAYDAIKLLSAYIQRTGTYPKKQFFINF